MWWIIHLLSLLLSMTPDRHTIRIVACQQHLLPLHQNPCILWEQIQSETSPVALHGRDGSIHMLRVTYREKSDTIAAKSFLPQQRGSFTHGSWDSLAQQLTKMQREAWQRNRISSERETLISASTPLGTEGSRKWELTKALPSLYCAILLQPAG